MNINRQILIADSGSTKTEWLLMSSTKKIKIITGGINPYFLSKEEIYSSITNELLPHICSKTVDAVFFYGSGCTVEQLSLLGNTLKDIFIGAHVDVHSDILAAARATCKNESSIVCILGTGSNSCFYNGVETISKIPSLGYVLGDEGGGVSLGKRLITAVFKNIAPDELIKRFHQKYQLSYGQILDNIYNKPFPNRYLAGFTSFIADNIDNTFIRDLVRNEFLLFITNNVKQYKEYFPTTVHFVGSVAFAFKNILMETAAISKISIGKIISSPINGLADYHCDFHNKRTELVKSEKNQRFVTLNTEQSSEYHDLEKKSIGTILKEINIEDQTVAMAVKSAISQIENLVKEIVIRMKKGGRLFYIGAGTSGRLGVLDASELPPTYGVSSSLVTGLIAGGDDALRNSIEHAEDNTISGWKELMKYNLNQYDTVIGIAASGNTPYVIAAMKKAREFGLLTACITNNPDSAITKNADIKIEIKTGPEYVTGSTRMKAGTSQKMVLNMISTTVMIQLGRVKDNKMINMQLKNNKLIDRGVRMIISEFNIDYDQAKKLLLQYGTVKDVFDNYDVVKTKKH